MSDGAISYYASYSYYYNVCHVSLSEDSLQKMHFTKACGIYPWSMLWLYHDPSATL